MNSDHPTMGDIAFSMSTGLDWKIKYLTERVERLENTVSDLLTTLSEDGTIEVTDPDWKGHFEDKESD